MGIFYCRGLEYNILSSNLDDETKQKIIEKAEDLNKKISFTIKNVVNVISQKESDDRLLVSNFYKNNQPFFNFGPSTSYKLIHETETSDIEFTPVETEMIEFIENILGEKLVCSGWYDTKSFSTKY